MPVNVEKQRRFVLLFEFSPKNREEKTECNWSNLNRMIDSTKWNQLMRVCGGRGGTEWQTFHHLDGNDWL